MNTTVRNTQQEIIEHAIAGLESIQEDFYKDDLHNELFNRDYFIIGYYQAEEFLKATDEGVFGAIELVKEYEQDNFGEVNTDFSDAEHVCNMYTYIKGEDLLYSLDSYEEAEESLTQECIDNMLIELREML